MKLLEDAHDYGDGHKQHENGELIRRKPEKADWFVDFSHGSHRSDNQEGYHDDYYCDNPPQKILLCVRVVGG